MDKSTWCKDKVLSELYCPIKLNNIEGYSSTQGIFVGNGRGCRTIWTFTEAKDTNTMWIMNFDDSRQLTKDFIDNQLTLEQFEKIAMEKSSKFKKKTVNPFL